MLRILHIVGKMDRAGAETMIMNLYRHLDKDQFQFDFLTFTKSKGDYDDEIISLGGKIYPVIASNPIKRFFKIKQFLKNNPQFSIVHTHMLLNAGFNILAAKQAGIKNRIVHSHSTTNTKNNFVGKIYQSIAKYLIQKYATVKIACGKEASSFLFGNNDSIILYNGINVSEYEKLATEYQNYTKEKFNIVSTDKIIIQVGRLELVKNLIFSLEIMKELKQTTTNFKFLIVGQGSLENQLKKLVSEYDLENHVIFTGLRQDVPQLMSGSDIMLMPSLYEGFPVVLVESQATGLCTLVSNNVSKEVDLGLNLIKFLDLNSPQQWANQIINHSKIYNNKTANVLKEKGFDVLRNIKKLETIYKNSK